MLAASAAFRAAPNANAAADFVGAMLTRWHYIALGAPLLLFALELRHARRFVLIVVFIAIVLAAAQAFVDLRIRAIRTASLTPISELSREDPIRRRFGMLHGVSMMLLLVQTIAATVVVAKPQTQRSEEVRKPEEEMVMGWNDEEDDRVYTVVMNHEEQYSIWPADREVPLGWTAVGKTGTKKESLAYIEEVWTDMRPLSLRKKMEEMEREKSGGGP